MNLSTETIKAITIGAMAFHEDAEGITPCRFTDRQLMVYGPDSATRLVAQNSASIALDFYTDSAFLRFAADGIRERGEDFVFFDLLVDGQLTQSFRHRHDGEACDHIPIPFGPVGDTFYLPEGEKRVTLYLPYAAKTRLLSVELSDGAFVRPCDYSYTWCAFGDSITHGYNAECTSLTFVNQLSRMLNAQCHNFGIGGQMFREKKIVKGTYPKCDFVTIAYGTNDYGHQSLERFDVTMPSFLRQAAEAFPDVPVFVITPTWRNDEAVGKVYKKMGLTLPQVRARIAAEAAKYPHFHVVDGSALVPHSRNFYGDDLNVHPNNAGFAHYAANLCKIITEVLK